MEKTTLKDSFAHTITELDNRLPKSMTDCERYGMTWGCDIDCPVLQRGECELKDNENKDLYNKYLDSINN